MRKKNEKLVKENKKLQKQIAELEKAVERKESNSSPDNLIKASASNPSIATVDGTTSLKQANPDTSDQLRQRVKDALISHERSKSGGQRDMSSSEGEAAALLKQNEILTTKTAALLEEVALASTLLRHPSQRAHFFCAQLEMYKINEQIWMADASFELVRGVNCPTIVSTLLDAIASSLTSRSPEQHLKFLLNICQAIRSFVVSRVQGQSLPSSWNIAE